MELKEWCKPPDPICTKWITSFIILFVLGWFIIHQDLYMVVAKCMLPKVHAQQKRLPKWQSSICIAIQVVHTLGFDSLDDTLKNNPTLFVCPRYFISQKCRKSTQSYSLLQAKKNQTSPLTKSSLLAMVGGLLRLLCWSEKHGGLCKRSLFCF